MSELPKETSKGKDPRLDALRIVKASDDKEKILRKKATAVRSFGPSLSAIARRMLRVMTDEGGIGLAANQVGLDVQLIVVSAEAFAPVKMLGGNKLPTLFAGHKAFGYAIVNPRILEEKPPMVDTHEGCLSLPGETYECKRFSIIVATWKRADGVEVKAELHSLASVIFQHERDHLRGVLISDVGVKLETSES